MGEPFNSLLGPLIGGLCLILNGAVAALIGWVIYRGRTNAEIRHTDATSSDVIADASLSLLNPLRQALDQERIKSAGLASDLDDLITERNELLKRNVSYRYGIRMLTLQIESLDEQPVWTVVNGDRS